MPSVALTDLDTLSGCLNFYQKASASGIKPIIGSEVHMAPDSRLLKEGGLRASGSPLVLLCLNRTGFQNLVKISSDASINGFYYRPRSDVSFLKEHSEGLVALSGNRFSEIRSLLLQDNMGKAEEVVKRYQQIYGEDNFFLELVNHGAEINKTVLPLLKELSQKTGSPTIVTNDVYMPEREDLESLHALQCIRAGKILEEKEPLEGPLVHFASTEEMLEKFSDDPDAIARTVELADRLNVEIDFKEKHMPVFKVADGETDQDELRRLVEKGLKNRFNYISEEIRDRIETELKVINDLKYASYFLIVRDFIFHAKDNDIPVGPGRGSCVGSLVSYVLGITELDPLKYDLLFERFLAPTRVGDPDIDVDFCRNGREKIIDYVREKYGSQSVAQIATFGTLSSKAVLRDIGRVLNIPLNEVDQVAKAIPDSLGISLSASLEESEELKNLIQNNGAYKHLWDLSLKLEGLHRHTSIHAAAVVIADAPLTNYIPLAKSGDSTITQYEMGLVEASGILKMDFLGLKTLTVIKQTTDNLKKMGINLDIETLPLDDDTTFAMLQKGESKNTFQFESGGMRELMANMKVNCFEDLIILTALYRPGTLDSGMDKVFVDRRSGKEKFNFTHPSIEKIMGDTYGILIYQEQVMLIANEMAGFTLTEADLLRKAMAKKKPELMATFQEKFFSGSKKNKVPEKVYKEMFANIETFSRYGFNKSHGAAYALISYQTCYLKANHPEAYMAALLTCDASNADKVSEIMSECQRMGIKVDRPDINLSESTFTVNDNIIRFGLSAIKGVGSKAIDSIIHSRDEGGSYKNLYDFCVRVDSRTVNKSVLEALIKSGALDDFDGHRAQLMASIESIVKIASSLQKDKQKGQTNLFENMDDEEEDESKYLMPNIPEWTEPQQLAFEKATVGFYVTNHPLTPYEKTLTQFTTANLIDIKEYEVKDKKEIVTLGGLVTEVRPLVTKKGRNPGQKMCAFVFEDLVGQGEGVVFPEVFKKYGHLIESDAFLLFKGNLDLTRDIAKILVTEVKVLENKELKTTQELIIHLNHEHVQGDFLDDLKIIFKEHKGNTPILLEITDKNGKKMLIRTGPDFSVNLDDTVIAKIKEIIGEGQLSYSSPLEELRNSA